MEFPNELFVMFGQQDDDCQDFIATATVEEHAGLNAKKTVARYRLVEELVVESKIVTTATALRKVKK